MTVASRSRHDAVRLAFVFEWLTVVWMSIEAVVAVASGVLAHSITLVAFGADSVVELLSAGVLIWRLQTELGEGREFSEGVERRAARIGGGLLYGLAVYIVGSAIWSIVHRQGEAFSLPGLILALVAIPVMYVLARKKLALAGEIDSRALRADAAESITCGYLSLVVVVGLLAQALLRAWWVDSVTSLAIVYFIVREAREAWAGEACDCAGN